jgi:hypothetical protein
MTTSQANPAYSSTTEEANPANPITAPEAAPKEKLSFAERHKAPTTKDVESNRWVFGAQQVVGEGGTGRGTGTTARDETYRNDTTRAAEGMGVGYGNGDRMYQEGDVGTGTGTGTAVGDITGTYRNDTMTGDTMTGDTYTSTARDNNDVAGDGSAGTMGGTGVVGGAATGYEGTRRVGDDGNLGGPGSGTEYEGNQGVRDDGVVEDGEGHKKMNPLKKIVKALGNV